MIIVLPLLTVCRLKSVSVCVLNIVISVIINGKLNKFIKFILIFYFIIFVKIVNCLYLPPL